MIFLVIRSVLVPITIAFRIKKFGDSGGLVWGDVYSIIKTERHRFFLIINFSHNIV